MTFVQLFMHMYTIWKHSSLSESFSFNASAPSILRAHGTTNVKGASLVDAFRSRHWVLTTWVCPPCPGFQSPPRIVIFDRQSQPKPSFATIASWGGQPQHEIENLSWKTGWTSLTCHRHLFKIEHIQYTVDVCPLFQLDAVWPTQMQHKTKKNSKTSHKRYHISFLYKNPWQPLTKHIKNMHPRVTCKGKKKTSPPSRPFDKPKWRWGRWCADLCQVDSMTQARKTRRSPPGWCPGS